MPHALRRANAGEILCQNPGGVLALPRNVLANDERLNALTGAILGAAIEVHRVLGPGLLESIYLGCLQFELSERGLRFEVQKAVPVVYKSVRLPSSHRIDLLIEDSVVVEVKALDSLLPVHQAQVLTYLRLTGCPAGLLVNFNVPKLTDGVRRLLNQKAAGASFSALTKAQRAANDEREGEDGDKRWHRQ